MCGHILAISQELWLFSSLNFGIAQNYNFLKIDAKWFWLNVYESFADSKQNVLASYRNKIQIHEISVKYNKKLAIGRISPNQLYWFCSYFSEMWRLMTNTYVQNCKFMAQFYFWIDNYRNDFLVTISFGDWESFCNLHLISRYLKTKISKFISWMESVICLYKIVYITFGVFEYF